MDIPLTPSKEEDENRVVGVVDADRMLSKRKLAAAIALLRVRLEGTPKENIVMVLFLPMKYLPKPYLVRGAACRVLPDEKIILVNQKKKMGAVACRVLSGTTTWNEWHTHTSWANEWEL